MDIAQYNLPGLNLERNAHGVVHIQTQTPSLFYQGLGMAHALDRGTQMLLMRILGKGEGSRVLEASDEMFEIDAFFRRQGWHRGLEVEVGKLTEMSQAYCEAYCDGVNAVLKKAPLALKLLGYKPETWTPADSVLLSRMTGYLTLAQSQAELEHILVEWVQQGISEEHLHSLFPEVLKGMDVELLKKVKLEDRVVPEAVLKQKIAPPMMASNNWVVAPKRSASGHALLANDPHLEGNRLPNVWYEVTGAFKHRKVYGATMPGLPGVLIGRTQQLSWGATYAFMDAVDSWVEECKGGQYRYKDAWHDFEERKEIIERKKQSPVTLTFYENHHGVLAGNPHEDGFYLSTKWSGGQSGARSLNAMHRILEAEDVPTGRSLLGQLETAWNWVLADSKGNIGYQMSGLCPQRKEGWSGLYPLAGWDEANDWQGFEPSHHLPWDLNPECGYIVTANQDLNALGMVSPINAPMGDYRARRITELLAAQNQLTLAHFKAMQLDVRSLQARELMTIIRPLLPDTPQGQILSQWDGSYAPELEAPYLFERVYQHLFHGVFGQVLGKEALKHLMNHSGFFADFYAFFDPILHAEDSPWFLGKTRDELYRPLIEKALNIEPQRWGQRQRFMLKHILLGDKLPQWFKVDHGPIELAGGRATPHQGQIYRSGERLTSFMPTYRMMTNMGQLQVDSCLLGGPSDNPRSPFYVSEVDDWQQGRYKTLSVGGEA